MPAGTKGLKMNHDACKICGARDLHLFKHTARCGRCGVLAYFPYPAKEELEPFATPRQERIARWEKWYEASAWNNHWNFSAMIQFALSGNDSPGYVDILDYGGGGGQFALVCKSMLPHASIYTTDIDDDALLPQYAAFNQQIAHADFAEHKQLFDIVFLNDVLEHVADPLGVLTLLKSKLKENGRIFIDTPRIFWIYPLLRLFSKRLYHKLCLGTVNGAHLQLWSKTAFKIVVEKSGLQIDKYKQVTEFTRKPEYYLDLMTLHNPLIRLAGLLYYQNAKLLARNKILAVLR